jgi:hypothetical protein
MISLDENDKEWLDRRAADEGVAMTELIRRAVRLLRGADRSDRRSVEELLRATAGTWKQGHGLEYQEHLRREW